MNIGWQETIALVLVTAAVVYLIRRLWRVGTGKHPAGCGGCSDCPASSEPPQLVVIDPPKKH